MRSIRNWYRYRVYPSISEFRGATRALSILNYLSGLGLSKYEGEPESIFSREWDVLILLDACRYDTYTDVFGDNVSQRVSLGCKTPEFIENTFSEGDYTDTVYVTANPYFHKSEFVELTGRLPSDVFHTVYHTYETSWNTRHNTVMPQGILDEATSAYKLFGDKRVVVHMMQPHYPFIGVNMTNEGIRPDLDHEKEGDSVWNLAEKGLVDRQKVVEAYKQNLGRIKPKLEEFSSELDGCVVVTSDHGNLLGENGLYGHNFEDSDAKSLRLVPWHVMSEK
jgi:hypothetical protein